jgi:hypothetical protein
MIFNYLYQYLINGISEDYFYSVFEFELKDSLTGNIVKWRPEGGYLEIVDKETKESSTDLEFISAIVRTLGRGRTCTWKQEEQLLEFDKFILYFKN